MSIAGPPLNMDTVYLKGICWHKQLVGAPRVHSAHSLQRAHAHQHMLVSCFFRPLKWTDANEPWTEAPHIRGSVGKRRSYKEREREREGWINAHKSPFWLAGWMATFGRRRKGGRGEDERERGEMDLRAELMEAHLEQVYSDSLLMFSL